MYVYLRYIYVYPHPHTTSIFAVTTLCLRGSMGSLRYSCFQVLKELSRSSKHHGELTTDHPQIFLCIRVTPDTLDDADYRALWGTGHHF